MFSGTSPTINDLDYLIRDLQVTLEKMERRQEELENKLNDLIASSKRS